MILRFIIELWVVTVSFTVALGDSAGPTQGEDGRVIAPSYEAATAFLPSDPSVDATNAPVSAVLADGEFHFAADFNGENQ